MFLPKAGCGFECHVFEHGKSSKLICCMFLYYREDVFLLVGLHFLLSHLMVGHFILGKVTMRIFSLVWLLELSALVFITFRKRSSS